MHVIRNSKTLGITVLLVEQNAYAALGIADRGYVMETGRMTMQGPAEELIADERIRAAYLGLWHHRVLANELGRPFGHLYKGKGRRRLPLIVCGTQSRLSPHNAIDSCIALYTSKRRIKRNDASAGKQVTHAGRGIERLGDADLSGFRQ